MKIVLKILKGIIGIWCTFYGMLAAYIYVGHFFGCFTTVRCKDGGIKQRYIKGPYKWIFG